MAVAEGTETDGIEADAAEALAVSSSSSRNAERNVGAADTTGATAASTGSTAAASDAVCTELGFVDALPLPPLPLLRITLLAADACSRSVAAISCFHASLQCGAARVAAAATTAMRAGELGIRNVMKARKLRQKAAPPAGSASAAAPDPQSRAARRNRDSTNGGSNLGADASETASLPRAAAACFRFVAAAIPAASCCSAKPR